MYLRLAYYNLNIHSSSRLQSWSSVVGPRGKEDLGLEVPRDGEPEDRRHAREHAPELAHPDALEVAHLTPATQRR